MPPHPEQLLISSILKTKDYQTAMKLGVNEDWFHVHDQEWRFIERYFGKYKKVPSPSAFKSRFRGFKLIKADDVEHFIEEVKKEHKHYSIQMMLDEVIESLTADDPDEALAVLSRGANELQHSTQGHGAELDIIQHWQDAYTEVSRRVASVTEKGLAGLPTGFQSLDLFTGGPAPGDLWIVAARLGNGKTWTMLRMACAALASGARIQFNALEQSKAQIAMRVHSFLSSQHGKEVFKTLDLMQGKNFDLRGYKKFLKDLPAQVNGSFIVSDTTRGRLNVNAIAAQIERNKPDIVFIDYLTLMETRGRRGEDEWRTIAKLSGELKSIAQQYSVPIVAASQINRAGEGKEPPKPEHLSQSDSIGMDADCVVTMKQQSKHVMKFRLAKFRNGQDGQTWFAEFNPNNGKYVEVSGDRAQEIIEMDAEEDE